MIKSIEALRRCGKCRLAKPLKGFGKHPKGRQWWCKACFRAYFAKRGKLHRDQTTNALRRRRHEARTLVNDHLAVGCSDCLECDPIVLESDHVGPKKRLVSEMIYEGVSVKRIREELEQCEVVCVNCHRRRTYARGGNSWRFDPNLLESSVSLTRGERRNRIFVRELLAASSCVDCGLSEIGVLEFDHLQNKADNVGTMARNGCSLERLRAEIDKCEIRCGNCHRRRTVLALRASRGDS